MGHGKMLPFLTLEGFIDLSTPPLLLKCLIQGASLLVDIGTQLHLLPCKLGLIEALVEQSPAL